MLSRKRGCPAPRALGSLKHLVSTAAVAAGMCFDRSCQGAMDTVFLVVVGLPLIALLFSIILAYRPLDPGSRVS